MKLDYVSLLSPLPFYLYNIGSIKSPTLLEISKITYPVYQVYLSNLLLDTDSYYKEIHDNDDLYLDRFTEEEKNMILSVEKEYSSLNEENKKNMSFYNILVFDKFLLETMTRVFNFFFEDEVVYDKEHKIFLLFDSSKDNEGNKINTGIIFEKNYDLVIDVILQRSNISRKENKALKVKNKIAKKLLEKMEKGNKKVKTKEDKKMELGNLISSISAHSKTLNIINIWDLTIFQFYDQFTRMRYDDSYTMNSTSVSVWGDKENKFDNTIWFSLINKD